MEFGDDHYTRDWKLLSDVAREWALIMKKFGFGSKEPLDRIEEHWEEIFNEQ